MTSTRCAGSVAASSKRCIQSRETTDRPTPSKCIPISTTTSCSLRMRNGTQGSICGAQGVRYGYDARSEILGEKGLITVGSLAAAAVTTHNAAGSTTPIVRSWTDLFLDAYRIEDEDFVRCVLENCTPRVGGVNGKAAVAVVNAGNRSIRERRPVRIERGRSLSAMNRGGSMLAATYQQGGTFAVREVPVPEIGRDGLLLRMRAASICGTDLKIIRNGHRKMADGQCVVLGHEFIGTIERVGMDVTGYDAGQRVGLVPNAGCGHCNACIRGQANYCPHYTAFGIDRNGAHAPFVEVPGRFVAQGNVIPLPEGVSDREASLLEPFSCVVNGIRVSRIELGDTVAIFAPGRSD